MSEYFPMYLDLEKANVLIVGAGREAIDKLEKLSNYHPLFYLYGSVAPAVSAPYTVLSSEKSVYEWIDCLNPIMIINSQETAIDAKALYAYACERKIPINTVDCPSFCTFIFPSIIKKGKLSIGISTSGASPAAARSIRQQMESLLPDTIDEILDWLLIMRTTLKTELPDTQVRKNVYRLLYRQAFEKKRPLDESEVHQLLKQIR